MICYSVDTVGQLSISDKSFVWASLSLWTARGVSSLVCKKHVTLWDDSKLLLIYFFIYLTSKIN